MIFNSIHFALFLIPLLLFYYLSSRKSGKLQNCILLLANYIFYAWADWRLLPILILSTILYFYLGLKIKSSNEKKQTG